MVSQTLAMALVASSALVKAMPPVQPPHIAARAAASNSSAYSLMADYSGSDFFNHFTPFTGADPTHGFVIYQDLKSAAEQKLVGYVYDATTNKTSAYMGVDHTTKAPTAGRNSVRLTGKDKFNAGSLAVIDLNHIPVAAGLWPAIWLLGTPPSGQAWPVAGESDILEYVHDNVDNAMTLHTAPGCVVQNSTTLFQGALANANCNAGDSEPGTTGCSITADNKNTIGAKKYATAGPAFNKAEGGVYVHDWQPDGITVWLFPHADVPADLAAGTPNPSSWTQKPLAKFSGSGCNYTEAFYDMSLIINLDFCGDWAGDVWSSSGLASTTGVATCNEYVANNPDVYKDSYFDIASVKFYSNNGQKLAKRDGEDMEMVAIPTITKPSSGHDISMSKALNATVGMSGTNGTSWNGTLGNSTIGNSTNANSTTGHGNYTFNSKRNITPAVLTSEASTMETTAWFAAAGMFILVAFTL